MPHDDGYEMSRTGRGRRAVDQIEGVIAKKVVAWLAGVLALALMAGTAWALDVRDRVTNLEAGQFTREEAARLRNAVDLLRLEITYLRRDLTVLQEQPR